eukprot:GDKJ01040782.1.p1 GENE.GDKJ01040782.1~~GDKJ01040782.1.p1  ORF type:complete len:522 (-),score=82.14 GDKJ01040782.1:166-1731(-)
MYWMASASQSVPGFDPYHSSQDKSVRLPRGKSKTFEYNGTFVRKSIYFQQTRNKWVVQWAFPDGKRRTQTFNCNLLGREEALRQAEAAMPSDIPPEPYASQWDQRRFDTNGGAEEYGGEDPNQMRRQLQSAPYNSPAMMNSMNYNNPLGGLDMSAYLNPATLATMMSLFPANSANGYAFGANPSGGLDMNDLHQVAAFNALVSAAGFHGGNPYAAYNSTNSQTMLQNMTNNAANGNFVNGGNFSLDNSLLNANNLLVNNREGLTEYQHQSQPQLQLIDQTSHLFSNSANLQMPNNDSLNVVNSLPAETSSPNKSHNLSHSNFSNPTCQSSKQRSISHQSTITITQAGRTTNLSVNIDENNKMTGQDNLLHIHNATVLNSSTNLPVNRSAKASDNISQMLDQRISNPLHMPTADMIAAASSAVAEAVSEHDSSFVASLGLDPSCFDPSIFGIHLKNTAPLVQSQMLDGNHLHHMDHHHEMGHITGIKSNIGTLMNMPTTDSTSLSVSPRKLSPRGSPPPINN